MRSNRLCISLQILAWLALLIIGINILLVLNANDPIAVGFIARSKKQPPQQHEKSQQHQEQQHSHPHPENFLPDERIELVNILLKNAARNLSAGDNCAPYPQLGDLYFEQDHYQRTLVGNISYYLFAAHYDRRQTLDASPRIALLAMISDLFGPYPKAYCQVWYEESVLPEIVEMTYMHTAWYHEWGHGPDHVYPVEMSCPLLDSPHRYRVPQLVSLVFEDRCARPMNALRVIYEAPDRKRSTRFAVCVKDLNYPDKDMTDRWVEWFELMRLLGAERIMAYDLGGDVLLESTRRTLKYYAEQNGLLQLRDHKLLQGHPVPAANYYLTRCLNEVLMYVDCLYRNMYQFDYVAVIDVDEVIMPLGPLNNWTAMVQHLDQNINETNCKAYASYCFRNVYYPKDLPLDESQPDQFYMLQHVHRVADHLDENSAIKCLHSTAFVLSTHNHFPFDWRGACGPIGVPTSIGQMQHYREPDDKNTLKEPPPVRDDNILRLKNKLVHNALDIHCQLDERRCANNKISR